MNFKKNKKGTQVGMIISFTLFVTFLLFTYVIIQPRLSLNNSKEGTISTLKENVLSKISEWIITLRVYDSTNSTGCIQTFLPQNDFQNVTTFAINSAGNEVGSYINSGNISLEGGQNLTLIYISNNSFSNTKSFSLTGCTNVKIDDLTKEKRITEKGILNLINDLQTNYSKIKNELGIPSGDDIDVEFNYPNGTIVGKESNQMTKSNIYAKTVQVNYLSLNGKEEVGGVILKLW